MSTSPQTDSLTNALRLACNPAEVSQALIDPTAILVPGEGGYAMPAGTLSAFATVQLRESAPNRTARIRVSVVDLTCTYTIDLSGTSVAYDATAGAPADLAELLAQWIAAVEADAPVDALITIGLDPDSPDDTLLIRWRSVVATGLDVTQSSSATLLVGLEYESCTAYLYSRAVCRVVLASDNVTEPLNAWQPHVYQGEPVILGLQNGQGWRCPSMPCANTAALGWVVQDLEGHADDGTSGSGVTYAYATVTGSAGRGLMALAAPGVYP